MQLVVVVAVLQGLGMHRFSLRLVRGDQYDRLPSLYLGCMLFNFCCSNFKLLLRFFMIVTISHFEMLYFELLLRFIKIVMISRFKMLYFEPLVCFIMISYS